jgi:sialic acid synthase SpsE/endonuclease IV
MKIGNKEISDNGTFIIAEIGNNHNGNFDLAIKMIDQAIDIGVDCVKFQMRNLSEVYREKSLKKSGEDLGTEYIIDLLNKFELSVKQHHKLYNYCKERNIIYMCTPWDLKSVDVLESFGVLAYKVASADLTNMPLINKLSQINKPLILSTGMSKLSEIQKTVNFLKKRECEFALLHCNSTYPAPFQDIQLNWMSTLKLQHDVIGYSGHERGISVSLGAKALGAKIIERHLTYDRNMEGPDHAASLEFNEFRELVKGIRELELALGSKGKDRKLSQGEMINRENLGKSLVASKDLKIGDIINENDVKVVSPGQGLSPQFKDQLVGSKIERDMIVEDFFFQSDITGKKNYKPNYSFQLKWGLPVRYHDFEKFNKISNPELFEFHLSYSDMDLKISDFLKEKYECGFVVHAPELFKGSNLMDLTSNDKDYLKFSISETQKVIEITKQLNSFFPNQIMPKIVANIGGFSMDKPFTEQQKQEHYNRFFESLDRLNLEGVEIIPQTMAPFPWHFGGQRYQNLFVHVDEIVKHCKENNLKMCFDVSHSMLTSNHFGYDFYEFAEKIAPFSAHIHMGDASGINGEGLQIGDGEINFNKLGKILKHKAPSSTFIPEIWQGHKNDGEGFFIALERLENIL